MEEEKIKIFWNDFVQKYQEYKDSLIPDADHLCDNEKDANELADLVLSGKKTGTCGALSSYEHYKDDLPKEGLLWIVTDFSGKPVCVTRTFKVSTIAYKDVNEVWAIKEGEGDLSLEYWQKAHWSFFERDLAEYGQKPSLDMKLVCEEFEVLK